MLHLHFLISTPGPKHLVTTFDGYLHRECSAAVSRGRATGDYTLSKRFALEVSTLHASGRLVLCCQEQIVCKLTFLAAVAFARIPQHLLLHAGLCCHDCTFGQAISELKAEVGVEMDDRHLLCLLLIIERAKGTNSKWHSYISYLPQTYGASCRLHMCLCISVCNTVSHFLHPHGHRSNLYCLPCRAKCA